MCGVCFPCKNSWKKKKKLQQLYEVGEERIESELNIVKFMNNLRNFKIVLKNSIMDPVVRKQIKHAEKNLIILDSSLESSNSFENFENCEENTINGEIIDPQESS